MKTIWKPIMGYEGLYEISNTGLVKSLPKKGSAKTFIKKPYKARYYRMCLSKNNKMGTYPLHRLIAIHFIPNPNNYPYVHHKNNDGYDNRIENLEWVTPSMNLKEAFRVGARDNIGVNHPNQKLSEKDVKNIRLFKKNNPDMDVKDIKRMAKKYKVTPPAIRCVLKRITWIHI